MLGCHGQRGPEDSQGRRGKDSIRQQPEMGGEQGGGDHRVGLGTTELVGKRFPLKTFEIVCWKPPTHPPPQEVCCLESLSGPKTTPFLVLFFFCLPYFFFWGFQSMLKKVRSCALWDVDAWYFEVLRIKLQGLQSRKKISLCLGSTRHPQTLLSEVGHWIAQSRRCSPVYLAVWRFLHKILLMPKITSFFHKYFI